MHVCILQADVQIPFSFPSNFDRFLEIKFANNYRSIMPYISRLKNVLSSPRYVCTGGGISSSHATPMFHAFIHITMLCMMFTNRLYSLGVTSSASIYLSARSHDAVKSMQFVP